jgi:imidazole glycerol-phosphate synthase subunit HisH
MVGVVDYGMGNLKSVYSALEFIGSDVTICVHPEDLAKVERIVIPGVGAIEQCILKLTETGFAEALNEEVLKKAKPTLGICLGMQVMCKVSHENGSHKCLNWFDAEVVKLNPSSPAMKVPNTGWNKTIYNKSIKLFEGLPLEPDFYFVHSYHVKTKDPNEIAATYEYGETVTAAIIKGNIFATQFHPEKSQDLGLKLLENFVKWKP